MTLYSIAPHAIFLRTLADKVIDGTLLGGADRSQPFWLSDVTIILPTRRAKLALADEFSRRGFGLLPDIRTFGGEADDEEPFLPPVDAPPLLPAATPLERQLVLSSLVDRWATSAEGRRAFSTPPAPAEILAMAQSLGELIDDLATEERGSADIRAIVPELGGDLGAYWQQTLTFLQIALEFWPARLAERGAADSTMLRRQRLDRQVLALPWLFGDRPVIAAGSTGSIPATARLLKAISQLPRGAVVLAGLDTAMSAAEQADLLDNEHNPHGHPQYQLARLLAELGSPASAVLELAATTDPRTTLVGRAMALAKDTTRWPEQKAHAMPMEDGMATVGVSIIAARNEDEEARAVALAARDALANRQSVGIVTPDRNLARRIAAELKRFDIEVDDAAGTPIFQSAVGRLLRQILCLAESGCGAVDLVALLRNRAALFGQQRQDVSRLADNIELGLLRGQRSAPGLAGLRALLQANIAKTTKYPAKRLAERHREPIETLFARIEAALTPLLALMARPRVTAGEFAEALFASFELTADGADMPGRTELTNWAAQMAAQAGIGHAFAPHGLDRVLQALMVGFQVRTRETRRQDIAIWGQLEARLQNPDLLIMAALNEDKWPETADPGPWLSRGMRLAAGLEPPERRQGQAAHDFVQGLGNERVIIAYANRVGTSPSLPSRLLQRLEAFAGTGLAGDWRQRGEKWLDLARRIDAVAAVTSAARPAPNPPAETRPRKLSVTEIETLMRSPYDVYAKHVLRLRPLDGLGASADARDRGNAVHDIFSEFVLGGHLVSDPGALDILKAIALEKFAGFDAIAERRDIWVRRFTVAAQQFLAFERERDDRVRLRHAEIDGRWDLPIGFALTGRADRVDELTDGTLEIIDFKTGSVPTPGAMRAFEAPQMLLEVAMAKANGMAPVPPLDTSALRYIKIGLGPDAFIDKGFGLNEEHTIMTAADEIVRRMQRHVELFLFRQTPMPPRLLPVKLQRFPGAYDHLMRMAEWTAVDEDDEDIIPWW
ncbi:MAG: double-strand break repair protein AddB [Devosia sp.]